MQLKLSVFSFPKTKRNNTKVLQFDNSLFMAISCTQVHFLAIPSSSEIPI